MDAGSSPSRATKERKGAFASSPLHAAPVRTLKGEECSVKRGHSLSETI